MGRLCSPQGRFFLPCFAPSNPLPRRDSGYEARVVDEVTAPGGVRVRSFIIVCE